MKSPGSETTMRAIQDGAEALDRDRHCPAVSYTLGSLAPRDALPGESYEVTLTVTRVIAPPRKAPRNTTLPAKPTRP